jgi:integrase
MATDDPRRKVSPHTLRHTAITWYLQPDRRTGRSLDIEIVSQYCGVSVATIRKHYRHVMAGTFNPCWKPRTSLAVDPPARVG